MRIVQTELESSVGKLERLPEPSLPEVAFAGRSNVGKSSLLNALTHRRSLFKVSKTPGRTRTLVHVKATLDDKSIIYLVDLPGFGFAKVSKAAQQAWAALIEGYLESRPTLHALFVLVDIRRGVQEEEADLVDFMQQISVPTFIVATKLDRLKKAKQKPALKALSEEIGLEVIGTSAKTGQGLNALLTLILKRTVLFS